jgi:hypothetical protein
MAVIETGCLHDRARQVVDSEITAHPARAEGGSIILMWRNSPL